MIISKVETVDSALLQYATCSK